jgi:hypothetical protein
MKKHVLLFFFASFCLNGFCQDYLIDLQKLPIHLPDRNFYVKEVVDARPVKTTIGQVHRGNAKVNANLRNGVAPELLACLNHNFPAKAGCEPLVLRVTKLKIHERMQVNWEAATAELSVEFFAPRGDRYVPVHRAAAVVQHKGIDVTGRHNDNIAETLQKCLRQLLESGWNEHLNDSTAVGRETLIAPVAELEEAQNYPICTAEFPAKGIYGSFKEFRNNQPGVTGGFTLKSEPRGGKDWRGTTEVTPYVANANGTPKPVRKVWGFSDGSTAYVWFRGSYFPVEIQDNVVTFYGYAGTDQGVILAGGTVGGMVGGAAGALVVSMATPPGKARYLVDMLTGEPALFEVNSDEGRAVSGAPARVILYCREHKTAGPALVTLSDRQDSLTAEMGSNSFTELEWPSVRAELSACVQGQTGDSLQFLPNVDQPNYLELVPADKTHPQPQLRRVNAQEAEFYLKKIKSAQEAAERRGRKQ